MALRSLLFLACATPVAGCEDCNIAKNGMWDAHCGAFYEESSKIADWTPTLFRRRLEAGVEAGDKADFKKFLTAMQRQGRIEVGSQTEAVDQASRRLSECTNTCIFNNDGECDDGQTGSTWSVCECGTDCSDCGSRTSCDGATDDYYTSYTFSTDSDFGCLKDVCCAEKKDDCCELNVGAVVGTAVALLVVLVGSILACCKFVPGCPMNNAGGKPAKRSPAAPVHEPTALAPIKAETHEMMEAPPLVPITQEAPYGYEGAGAFAAEEEEVAPAEAVFAAEPPPPAQSWAPELEQELEPEC